MARFLTTKGIGHGIGSIIRHANEYLYLLTYSLKISDEYISKMHHATERNVKISVIYGVDKIKEENLKTLKSLSNTGIYQCTNLHAKIYLNEKEGILTSMNLYDYSELNNKEMGIYFSKELDSDLYEDCIRETKEILESAKNNNLDIPSIIKKEKNETANIIKDKVRKNGYCINCGDPIPFDPSHPFCKEHQEDFDGYISKGKHSYKFKFCHKNGDQVRGKKVTAKKSIRE